MKKLLAVLAVWLQVTPPLWVDMAAPAVSSAVPSASLALIGAGAMLGLLPTEAEAWHFHGGANHASGGGGGGGGLNFTALHTRFLSATGNDSTGNGTAGNPWLTPNHPTQCGDVFIEMTSLAYGAETVSTQPTSCPSTSAGIDGLGGIYSAVVLCAGNPGTCLHTGSGSSGAVYNITASNWTIEGVAVTSTNIGASGMRGFQCDATASGTTILHHVSFINDIAYHVQQAFAMNEGALNHNVPGNGCDYMGIVGDIAQNANNDPICLAAFDIVAPANFDSNSGTHFFLNGNFAMTNSQSNTCNSDMQAYMPDTLDAHGYGRTLVFSNNIAYNSTRYGFQAFYQAYNVSAPTLKVYNNTYFADLKNVGSDTTDGEINFGASTAGSAGNSQWVISINNNIARTNAATSNGNPIYAMVIGGTNWGASGSLTNSGNVLFGSATTCTGTCDSTKSESNFNSNPLGSNTFVDPAFRNSSDLLTNWIGAPNCSSYATTTKCMGYDVTTSTLAASTPIYDLQATATGTSGTGYTLPSSTCGPNADYPTWLKGVVRLSWNGTALTENPDLVSKPCNL